MTTKLPWATAAVIVVAVMAIAAWSLWPTAPTVVTGVPGELSPLWRNAKITAISPEEYVKPTIVIGAAPVGSGIENIYVMKGPGKYDNTKAMNSTANLDNILGTIEASGGSVAIPYDTAFDIVIAYKAHGDNTAYNAKENAQIEVQMSGKIVYARENVGNAFETIFENVGAIGATSGSTDYIRVNVVHDNWVNKTLAAGESVTIDIVKLWCWG